MRILLAGATGLIGSALVDRLQQDGHLLRLAVRRPAEAQARWPEAELVPIDFNDAVRPEQWIDALKGVEIVINAVGIIREHGAQRFETLHVAAPIALFEAAARTGVGRIIQISALGADAEAISDYHLSKRRADAYLLACHDHAAIVQPSLVFDCRGSSAQQFLRMAASPIIPLPGKGQQRVQPIHIDDLCECIARLLVVPRMPPCTAAVGPHCLNLRDYLEILRSSLGVGRAWWLQIPMPVMRLVASLGHHLRNPSLDRDRLAMLERGNCADAGALSSLLGRAPRPAHQFIRPAEAPMLLGNIRRRHGLSILRASIATVWLISGVVSLGLWPIEDSLSLLARCGLSGNSAVLALYGASAMDIGLGVGTIALRGRPLLRLYEAQMLLIVAYSVLIGIFLPEFLVHPFAPVVKNLPILAALALLRWSERP